MVSTSVSPGSEHKSNSERSTAWTLMSKLPMTDRIHRSAAAVLLVLRAQGKYAVVREEISERDKLLRVSAALTRSAETPVQVSAADSWGYPDIDFFFIRLCGRPPTPPCVRDALSNSDPVRRKFTLTHTLLQRTTFPVSDI